MGHAFHALARCEDSFVLCESNRGAGKTRAILSILMARALAWPGSRWGLFRSTRTRLSETVMTTLEQQVFPAFGMRVPGASGAVNRTEYKLSNGSVFLPIGLDDIQRSTSLELAGGYLAEAIEMDRRDAVLSLAGCLRQSGVPFHQLIVDTNPGPPMHWLNQAAEIVPDSLRMVRTQADYKRLQKHNKQPAADPSRRWKRIIARHQDNPGYFDVSNWDWTDQGRKYMKTLDVLSGHLRARWLDGLWKAAEGSVYPNYSEELNQWRPLNPPADWPLYFGTDPGFDHPWSNQWFTVAPTNELIVVAEIVTSGMGSPEIVAEIKKLEQARGWTDREITRYGDPQYCFSATAMSKKTIAEQWSELGLNLHPWPRTGDNMDGMVDAVRSKVNDRSLIICDDCPKTIAAVQSWSFARNNDGSVKGAKGKDAYEEEYKDPNDVIRGIVALGPKYHPDKFSFDSNRE